VAPTMASDPVGPITGRHYPDSLIRPDRGGFQPRIGISWRPFPASSTVIRAGYGVYYNTSVYNTIALQMAQQPPLSKTLSVQNSPENPLTLANGFISPASSEANTYAVDPDFQVGHVQSWQLSVQRDLPGALVMIATYLGAKGTRGVQQFLPNTYPAGAVNPCSSCPAGYAYLASNGNSTRQAGQIQLRRRLQSGFTATLQYTFAKAIDDAALGGRSQGPLVIAQNWLDLGAERGLSGFDQRHLMNLQLQYTSGMGARGGMFWSGWKGRLFKEWTFLAQITAGSGFPLTPVYPNAVKDTGVTGSIRPDYTGAPLYESSSGRFLNPAAYAVPAAGHWGNAGRNSIIGPSQFAVNASLGRTLRVHDKVSLDLRIESANVINHVTFPGWNTTITSSQFGLPAVANPMRTMQANLRARF
jgi:trimeric autotransporter adhesin